MKKKWMFLGSDVPEDTEEISPMPVVTMDDHFSSPWMDDE